MTDDPKPHGTTLALIRRYSWVAVAGLLVAVVLSGIYQHLTAPPVVKIGGPFRLTDQYGKQVTDLTYRGKVEVIYFGFTSCPDACPTSLALIAQAIKKLAPEQASQVQPIFITLDPERDNTEVLGAYVKDFLPNFEALTGKSMEILNTTREFRVAYQKVKDPNSSQPYTIDHASIIFVMGKDGQFRHFYTQSVTADQLADGLRAVL